MILNKVTVGFVCQRFDTETGKFIDQEFISGDDTTWEDTNGDEVERPDNATELNMEMVQPKQESGVVMDATPLLAKANFFYEGERVLVTPTDNPNDLVRNEFMGTIVRIRSDVGLIEVVDASGDSFDVDPVQVHHVK